MNYKIRVKNEAESREVQGLLFELGYIWLSGAESPISLDSPYLYTSEDMGLWCGDWHSTFNECGKKKLTIPQLKDMVVLKRNDVADATHKCIYDNIPEYFMASDGVLYFYENTDWVRTKNTKLWCDTHLKPITKEPVMKEYLNKLEDGTYKLVVLDSVADGVKGLIEVPEGADTLAGDERTHYFWKHGVGVKGNMLIGCGESLSRYPKWDDCEDSADEWLGQINCEHSRILWQRETLNDKVASAEVARQSGVFVGAPFSDLPEFDFKGADGLVDAEFFPNEKHAHYKKDISHLNTLDIYRVTELFNPHSCGAHIAKKALCSGQRGHKDLLTDIQDIIDTAERWKEMLIEDEKAK